MLRTSLTTAGLLLAGASAYGQAEFVTPMTSNARQVLPPSVFPSAPVGGSDSCATPDIITGVGPHAFDTTLATTGTEGQSTVNCIFYSLIAIDRDVWFEWTAPATGTYELTSCGQTTVDTKIAVYSGAGCPIAGGSAAGCADDLNGATGPGNFQSRVVFAATAGQQMTIQVGGYPGTAPFTTDPPATPGPGTFTINQQIFQNATIRDDGNTENATRSAGPAATPSQTTLWLVAQGDATTGLRNVTSVEAAFGALPFAGATGVVNGATVQLGVWEDPNDDGNPADAVLLTPSTLTVAAAAVDTDTLTSYPITPAVTVDKVYFVGVSYNHGAGVGFPCPLDVDGCEARPGQNWLVGNAATTVDMTTLSANTAPPFNPGGAAQTIGFLLRSTNVPASTGTPYCFGDGTGTACPCGNTSVVGANQGCVNSLTLAGQLRAIGNPVISADTLLLQGSNVPNGPGLYFQGPIQLNAGNGAVFGDGIRCVGGTVIRLGIVSAAANASTYPFGATPPNNIPIATKGLVTTPGTLNYQLWYRDSGAFCTAAVFNLTNGLNIVWTP